MLISIGYSACHWCHVMEHESFEDEQVAALMNEHFINVKVDREERSDVDMIYMQAVQLMTGHGGWPLNCFVLPDGRPFYGGTYFNKTQWINILQNLSDLYRNESKKVEDYAAALTEGIAKSELIATSDKNSREVSREVLQQTVAKWKARLDNREGGPDKAPKFPLPSNYSFLLRYSLLEKDTELLDHVNLTLTKMAFGGINDQLHGGFARYSTDIHWKVPHFEKMLYDNAQLAALYSEAFISTGNVLYKETAEETLDFVKREWYRPEGYFYSAYDADSDGEEGKYYVWNLADLKDLLGGHFEVFSKYYEINEKGYWEHGNYILMRSPEQTKILAETGLTRSKLEEKITLCKKILKQEVLSRIKPGLDDKTITAWNAMMCSAFARAYLCFENGEYRQVALQSADFITRQLSTPEGMLYRTYKNGASKISGFLDDYAFVIEAFINCYLVTQDEQWLSKAKSTCELALQLFHNPESEFLFYTDDRSSDLITRTSETHDNVIPASNSQMALNLFTLGHYYGIAEWVARAGRMLSMVTEEMKGYGSAYSNWGLLGLQLAYPFREVAIVGKNVDEKFRALYKHGVTNAIFAPSTGKSELPLVKDRLAEGKTLIYVCENNTCRLPVETIEQTLSQLA